MDENHLTCGSFGVKFIQEQSHEEACLSLRVTVKFRGADGAILLPEF